MLDGEIKGAVGQVKKSIWPHLSQVITDFDLTSLPFRESPNTLVSRSTPNCFQPTPSL